MIIIWQGWIMILTCSANTSNQCKALTPWHRLVAGLITNLLIVYDSMIDPNFKAYYCSDLPWIFTRGDNAGVSQGEVLLLGSCWQQLTCLPPLVPKQSLEKIWRKGFNSGWLLGVLIISSGTCPQWRLGITKIYVVITGAISIANNSYTMAEGGSLLTCSCKIRQVMLLHHQCTPQLLFLVLTATWYWLTLGAMCVYVKVSYYL